MDEYLYRKRVCCQSRPAFLLLHFIMAAAIVFSGPLVPAVPVLIVAMRVLAVSHAQIQYFLPRPEPEIKRQSIVNVTMICMEAAVCMMLWIIPSLFLFTGLGGRIRKFPVFTVLWILAMILSFFRAGFSAECHRWSGADSHQLSFFQSMRQDIWGTITGFFTNVFLVFFMGYNFCFGWLEVLDEMYQSPVVLFLLMVTIILTVTDSLREIRAWTLADYR